MEKVYIISRYSAKTWRERRFNIEVTKYFCRKIMQEGKRPVAPHLFYTQFSNDDDPQERRLGLDFAIKDLDECDSFLLVLIDGVISEGMRGEIEHISRVGKKGELVALSREQAKKLIEGRETDDTARDQHRPGGRLRGGVFQPHKKA